MQHGVKPLYAHHGWVCGAGGVGAGGDGGARRGAGGTGSTHVLCCFPFAEETVGRGVSRVV